MSSWIVSSARVRHVFGVPGGALGPLYEALSTRTEIRPSLVSMSRARPSWPTPTRYNLPINAAGIARNLGAWSAVVSDPDAIARILHGAHAPPAPPPPGQLLLLP